MKKANVQQAFTIIASVVIMGVLLIFGTRAIGQLMENKDRLEDVEFRNEITREIDSIRSKYGSVKILELTSLNKYDAMCVFDLDKSRNLDVASSYYTECLIDKYPLIFGHISDGTSNIFLFSNMGIEQSFLNENLEVIGNSPCSCVKISRSGIVKIRLEGLGRTAGFEFIED